ncbi:hypothetical protein HOY80DRAFT_1032195 [Tuber brumale]|nr:hypothetical protein HOY80DRAFT_1050470 [Tuber brumale]KAG0643736.1 hypothetical protein HOY80DRAFT_1032195 [Tuber brumale]
MSLRVKMQMTIVRQIKEPELVASLGITPPFGILLLGPPVCGETIVAKAAANKSVANFIMYALVCGEDLEQID